MALEQKLTLKLAQKLVMTPSLQQAIRLLQMTRIELESAVNIELEQNPVLDEQTSSIDESAGLTLNAPEFALSKSASEEDFEIASIYENIDSHSPGVFSSFSDSDGFDLQSFDRIAAKPDGLIGHLEWQLLMLSLDHKMRELCTLVIGNLDEDGFLCADPDDIRGLYQGHCTLVEVEEALETVRHLDPVGIAYSDLQGSLLRQIQEHSTEQYFYAAEFLIRDHWNDLLQKRFDSITKTSSLKLEEIQYGVELISRLEIRPGGRFARDSSQYIEPDVFVFKVGDEYVVQLNEDGLPRLRINRLYSKMLQNGIGDRAADQYIKDKMKSAIWLIRSIDQRQRTIFRVASSIVAQQRAFFDFGVNSMRPMILRDVAEDIGMHESTVSRVVSNKYMHTPQGILPMKFFFHSKIDRDTGEDISSLSVKQKIRQIINEEDQASPFSDSDLSSLLKKDGVNIARRTIAKYRDELGIPSSSDRRRLAQVR